MKSIKYILLPQLFLAFLILFLINHPVKCRLKYLIPCKGILLNESEKVLLKQVGVKEKTGRNDGFMVESYLKSVGLSKGNPYCAAGQYYCFYVACNILKLSHNYIPLPSTGLANSFFNHAQALGNLTRFSPKKHDLIVWKQINKPFGHVERIISVNKAGWVTTVGFNTGSGNPRDGGGVYIRKRNVSHPLGSMILRGLIGFSTY